MLLPDRLKNKQMLLNVLVGDNGSAEKQPFIVLPLHHYSNSTKDLTQAILQAPHKKKKNLFTLRHSNNMTTFLTQKQWIIRLLKQFFVDYPCILWFILKKF